MDYERIYKMFITDRQAKEPALVESGEYFEKHHILPRSLGGSDDADNLVCLTAGDHYIRASGVGEVHGGPVAARCAYGQESRTVMQNTRGSLIRAVAGVWPTAIARSQATAYLRTKD